jgi:hypothetical protein
MSLSRAVLNSLLPEGAFWTPAAGDDYDKLLQGVSDNSEAVYSVMKNLAYLREPYKTPILEDVEKEYGIYPHWSDTETLRRQRLASRMYQRGKIPTTQSLQEKLRAAGFTDIYVYSNVTGLNPADLIRQGFSMTCGDGLQAGEPEAVCQNFNGELIVNGDMWKMLPNYVNLAGEFAVCCDPTIQAGDFLTFGENLEEVTYSIPTDQHYWKLFFIVSGEALSDSEGNITTFRFYNVPMSRRYEIRRLILQYKSLHAWGLGMLNYV